MEEKKNPFDSIHVRECPLFQRLLHNNLIHSDYKSTSSGSLFAFSNTSKNGASAKY